MKKKKSGVLDQSLEERKWDLREECSIPTLRVRAVEKWRDRWQLQRSGREITLAELDRVVFIESDDVPHEVRSMLHV